MRHNTTIQLLSLLLSVILMSCQKDLAELCRRLLDYDVFVTEVKKLKPWGDEGIVIIPYSYTVGDSSESVQEVMVFQYNPLIQ